MTHLKTFHNKNISHKENIEQWYQDSKEYAYKYPFIAFLTVISVFFGLTKFQ